MAPSLSGNTLGLKFMQRGAAAKAAAADARNQAEIRKHAELKRPATQGQAQVPQKGGSGSSSAEDSSSEDEEVQAPIASTSALPARRQPKIISESSYLAFPILSSAYGVASTTEVPSSVNGRFSFGEKPKKQKQRQMENDVVADESDEESQRRHHTEPATGKKEKKLYSISAGGSGMQNGPSIREQQRARATAQASRQPDSHTGAKLEEDTAVGDVEYEEDTGFVDDMMNQARQKRRLDASQNGRKKLRKDIA